MPLLRRSASVTFAALLIGTIPAASWPRATTPPPAFAKIARIHAHFDSVLIELRAGDVAHPGVDQRLRRSALIATLASYDARGVFPNNYDFPERLTPYFVDRKTGTRCAVAHLLESTGRADIVNRVARVQNNVWVAELAGDTAVAAWLEKQGITLAEAARIQVPYDGGPSGTAVVALSATAVTAAASALGTTLWNASANRDGHSRFGNVLGLTSGVLTTALGTAFAQTTDTRGQRNIGMATAAVGGLSVALATRSLRHRGRTLAAQREAARAREPRRGATNASVVPIIPMGTNPGTGLAVQIRF